MTRHLHSKVIVSDDSALVLTANLTDTDLFRNTNHLCIERDRQQVEAAVASLLKLEEEGTPDSGYWLSIKVRASKCKVGLPAARDSRSRSAGTLERRSTR